MEGILMEEVGQTVQQEEMVSEQEVYSFCFALTDEDIRNRVVEFIKPITSQWEIINLQLAYGVLETVTNIFIVHTKSAQILDDDTGIRYDTSYFAALTKDSVMSISYTIKGYKDEGEATYDVPKEYAEVLTQALEYWRNWDEHKRYEIEYNKLHKEQIMLSLISEYRKPLYKLLPKEEAVSRKAYEINCIEDAKKLFYLCNKNYYDILKKQYDDTTIETFNKYVDQEQKVKWAIEDCEEVLNKIIEGDMDKLYKKLNFVSGECYSCLSDPNDMAELYYRACQVMFSKDVYVPLQCINSYLSTYETKFNPQHAVPILDLTEQYIKEKYPEADRKSDCWKEILKFQERCLIIRGRIVELLPIDNKYKFEFVLTKPEILDVIVRWYYKKYNNMGTVKEILAEINCVYGVQNDEIFLTAMTDSEMMLNNVSFYGQSYIVVNLKEGTVKDFECKQKWEDGSYYAKDRLPENLLEITMSAVAFFNNQQEREQFFEDYTSTHNGENVYYTKEKARKTWLSSLGKNFKNLLKRIEDNPLGDTLKRFVEMCEVIAPGCGYKSVVVNKRATVTAIEKWEQKNEIHLPESYRHFLRFANGYEIESAAEWIAGLDGIVLSNEHIKSDYMIIGGIIGDGTTLCMEKNTGETYIEDHGDYKCMGEFKDLLEYIIDMHIR